MCVLIRADMPVAFLETSSRMHIFGDNLGSTIVVRGALHTTATCKMYRRGIVVRQFSSITSTHQIL